MKAGTNRQGIAVLVGAVVVCGLWLAGCGSEEGPASPMEMKQMMVNGRVVSADTELSGARLRLTSLGKQQYGADLVVGPDGTWGWAGPQGRYRAEVLVDGKAVLTKEIDLTKANNPGIELTVP